MLVRELCDAYLRHSALAGTHCPEGRVERERILGLFCAASCAKSRAPATGHIAFAVSVPVQDVNVPATTFGDLEVCDCKIYMLSDWVESHAGWKSVATRRSKANYIRAAFQWAKDGERIDRNPFARVRYEEAGRRPDLPDDIFEEIARVSNKAFERAVRFLRLTGCRLSELCQATWDQFDLAAGLWTIAKHKARKKTGRVKVVALVLEAVEFLKSLASAARVAAGAAVVSLEVPAPTEYVFVNTRGTPWNRHALGSYMRSLKKRGINTSASLHGLRHAAATTAIRNGANLKYVSLMLGHASQQTTEKFYLHVSSDIEAIRAAATLAQPKKPTQ